MREALKVLLSGKVEYEGEIMGGGNDALALSVFQKALKGDVQAFKEICDTVGEKLKDMIELEDIRVQNIEINFVDKSRPVEKEEQAVEEQQDLSEMQAKEDEKQAVIDGLQAKVKALKEELKFYRDKVDGAFGYEKKTNTPVKVNALYDNCEGIKFKK